MTPSTTTLDWLRKKNLQVKDGKVVLFKAVRKNLHSKRSAPSYYSSRVYGSAKKMQSPYVPGSTLTAPDWQPNSYCGNGLHLCATPLAAGAYLHDRGRRYVAVEVDIHDIRVIDAHSGSDKVKVRTLKVLYEVDFNGNRIAYRGPTGRLKSKPVSLVGATVKNYKTWQSGWSVAAIKNGMVALLGPNAEVKLISETNLRKSYNILAR